MVPLGQPDRQGRKGQVVLPLRKAQLVPPDRLEAMALPARRVFREWLALLDHRG